MRTELVISVLAIWFCWAIFVLSTALVVFNRFSEKKIFKKVFYKNIWLYIFLGFVFPNVISMLFYEKGSKVPGALLSYFNEFTYGGIIFATFILYVILTFLLIIGIARKSFLGFKNKSRIIISYFILLFIPIIYLTCFVLLTK